MSRVQIPANYLMWAMIGVMACPVSAQDARTVGMAGAGIAIPTGAGQMPNPASLGDQGLYTGVLREYGIDELTSGVVDFAYGMVQVGYSALAFESYSESILAASLKTAVGPAQFGGRLTLEYARIAGYQPLIKLDWTGGYLRRLWNGATIGGYLSPSELGVGAALFVSPGTVALDLVRSADGLIDVRVAWVMELTRTLEVRAGITSAPPTLAIGAGVSRGSVRADVGFARHEVLGITQAWGISWRF